MKKCILLITITLLAALFVRYKDFFAIDECLDAGGAWDTNTRTCHRDR